MRRLIAGVLGLAFSSVLISSAYGSYVYSDYTWQTYNGHQYAVTFDYNTWTGAEAEAQAVGGHLVTVNDSQENSWLANNFGGYYSEGHEGDNTASFVWIGLKNVLTTPEWASGEPVSYTAPIWSGNWATTTPPYAYLHTSTHFSSGTWWNSPGDSFPRGIIETPEPSTLVLLGIGAISLLGYAWRRRRRA